MGGCFSLIAFFLILALLLLYAMGMFVVIDLVVLILFIWSFATYRKLKGACPSIMKCGNCGSSNVRLSTRRAGYSSDAFFWMHWMSRRSTVEYDRIAICQDCGFTWNYITAGDILGAQKSARARMIIFGIMLLVCGFITWFLFGGVFTDQDGARESNQINRAITSPTSARWEEGFNSVEKIPTEEPENDESQEDISHSANERNYSIDSDRKYTINKLLFKYNEFAEYPIDEEFISDVEEMGRPLEKTTITLDNGVYVILQYNDFNNKLFIDYQDEAYDSNALLVAFRDFSKAVNTEVTDKDIKTAWGAFESGKYSDYYGERYDLKGIVSTYMKNVLNSGIVRYTIKCEYEIKSS